MDFSQKKFIFPVLFFIACLVLANILLFSIPKGFKSDVILNIKEGSSLRSVSRYLEENDFIKSRVVFETFAIIFGGEKHLVSGDYFFEDRLSAFEIARRLSKGERHLAPVKVTIPEGFNSIEISQVFSSRLMNFNADKFLSETSKKEGYLFPDTYFFLTTDNEEDVLDSMTKNFEKKISSVRPKILSSGKTEKEIITMASLIEEESKGDTDRRIISGILWKRIKIGMPLQVDAYPDTYKTRGLPGNPISNPGLESIEASLYPQNSPYLYYLHDRDGDIHFAKSFEEHQQNINKYLKNQ